MHSLKFVIGSGEATPGGLLAPVLAPYGLDLQQISKEINAKTNQIYTKGVPVSIKLFVLEERRYRVEVGHPTLSFLYSNLKPAGQTPTVMELYTLFLLFCQDRSLPHSIPVGASFFGSLLTLHPTPVFKLE